MHTKAKKRKPKRLDIQTVKLQELARFIQSQQFRG